MMVQRTEATAMYRQLVSAAVVIALGGIVAAILVAGEHSLHDRAVVVTTSLVSLTVGLYSVYVALKMTRPATMSPIATSVRVELRDAEPKPSERADLVQTSETSPLEIRLTDSLKSIREQAEQGLVASDAEKAQHLAAIWSMAASDLDDDPDQVAH